MAEPEPPRRVWIDFDGDGVADLELTDEEVLARLFPPEVLALLADLVIKDKDT